MAGRDRTRRAHHLGQQGPGLDADFLGAPAVGLAGPAVRVDAGILGDVLVEGAAERGVEDLEAAADREGREPAGERIACEGDLEVVDGAVHAVRLRVRRLPERGRIEVGDHP